MSAAKELRLGLVVPARDEASTIEAKLADLARTSWPERPSRGPHVVVIVDDHSGDTTAWLAARAGSALVAVGVEVHVVTNESVPGKPAAIRRGLAQLAELGLTSEGDLVVLTDADVALGERALVHLAREFAEDPRLAMACGAQAYVRDGDTPSESSEPCAAAPTAPSGGAAVVGVTSSDMGLYDRAFAFARRLESCFGALLSVHGQLLAWRASLALAPPDGRAADDLELVVAARDRAPAPRVRLVAGATFIERRAPAGAPREAQALRRARAWFQHFDGPPPRRLGLRVQWSLWRLAPGFVCAATAPLAWCSPAFAARRRVWLEARELERRAPLASRWEVARG